MKGLFFRVALLTALMTVFCGAVHGQVCTSYTSAGRLCLEIQDESGNVLDTPYPFNSLFREVNLDFGSFPYGKAVLKRVIVKNSSAGVNGSVSGNASNGFIWAWQNETPLSFIEFGRRTPTNIGGVRLNGLGTMPLDIVYAPLPGNPNTDGLKVNLEHNPFQYVDRVSALINPITLVNSNAGMGKKFDVAVENNGGETPVLTVTPVDIPALGTDEYLLVYMEKEQLGDQNNPLVPLHFEERAINARFPELDQIEPSAGQPNWGFYRVPGSDNIVVRFRGPEQKTIRYWFLFKDATPVQLKNHAYTSSVSTSANLKFVYANADGSRNEFVQPVTVAGSTIVNNAPYTPRNPAPSNGSTGDEPMLLSWQGDDPDGDAVTYKVEFGPSPSTLASFGTDGTSWALTGQSLQKGFTYYWRITASDGELNTEGPLWSFTVAAGTTPPTPTPGTSGFSEETLLVKERGEKYILELTLDQTPAAPVEIALGTSPEGFMNLSSDLLIFGAGERTAAFSIEVTQDLEEDVTLSASGIENYTMVLKSQPQGKIIFDTETIQLNPGATRNVKLSLDHPAADFSRNHVAVTFETDSDSFRITPSTVILTQYSQTVSIEALGGITYPAVITAVAEGDDYTSATLDVQEDQRVRMPAAVQDGEIFHLIQADRYQSEPVMPTGADPIAQPLSVGDPLTGFLDIVCKFPVYEEPVDIYVGFELGGVTYFFWDDGDDMQISAFGSIDEAQPLFAGSQSQVEKVLSSSIPVAVVMPERETLNFITLVVPQGEKDLSRVDGTRIQLDHILQ